MAFDDTTESLLLAIGVDLEPVKQAGADIEQVFSNVSKTVAASVDSIIQTIGATGTQAGSQIAGLAEGQRRQLEQLQQAAQEMIQGTTRNLEMEAKRTQQLQDYIAGLQREVQLEQMSTAERAKALEVSRQESAARGAVEKEKVDALTRELDTVRQLLATNQRLTAEMERQLGLLGRTPSRQPATPTVPGEGATPPPVFAGPAEVPPRASAASLLVPEIADLALVEKGREAEPKEKEGGEKKGFGEVFSSHSTDKSIDRLVELTEKAGKAPKESTPAGAPVAEAAHAASAVAPPIVSPDMREKLRLQNVELEHRRTLLEQELTVERTLASTRQAAAQKSIEGYHSEAVAIQEEIDKQKAAIQQQIANEKVKTGSLDQLLGQKPTSKKGLEQHGEAISEAKEKVIEQRRETNTAMQEQLVLAQHLEQNQVKALESARQATIEAVKQVNLARELGQSKQKDAQGKFSALKMTGPSGPGEAETTAHANKLATLQAEMQLQKQSTELAVGEGIAQVRAAQEAQAAEKQKLATIQGERKDIQGLIGARNKETAAIAASIKQIQRREQEEEKEEGFLHKVSEALFGKGFAGNLAKGIIGGTFFTAAISGLGSEVAHLIELLKEAALEGGRFSQVRNSFVGVAGGVQQSNDLLDKMREKSEGMISDMTLMKVAVAALSHGFGVTTDEVVKLVGATSVMAERGGKMTPEAAALREEQMLSRGRFQARGVSLGLTEAEMLPPDLSPTLSRLGKEQETVRHGIQQFNETYDKMEQQGFKLPVTVEATVAKIKTAWSNLFNWFAEGFNKSAGTQVFLEFLNSIGIRLDALGPVAQRVGKYLGDAFAFAVPVAQALGDVLKAVADLIVHRFQNGAEAMAGITGRGVTFQQVFAGVSLAIVDVATAITGLIQGLDSFDGVISRLTPVVVEFGKLVGMSIASGLPKIFHMGIDSGDIAQQMDKVRQTLSTQWAKISTTEGSAIKDFVARRKAAAAEVNQIADRLGKETPYSPSLDLTEEDKLTLQQIKNLAELRRHVVQENAKVELSEKQDAIQQARQLDNEAYQEGDESLAEHYSRQQQLIRSALQARIQEVAVNYYAKLQELDVEEEKGMKTPEQAWAERFIAQRQAEQGYVQARNQAWEQSFHELQEQGKDERQERIKQVQDELELGERYRQGQKRITEEQFRTGTIAPGDYLQKQLGFIQEAADAQITAAQRVYSSQASSLAAREEVEKKTRDSIAQGEIELEQLKEQALDKYLSFVESTYAPRQEALQAQIELQQQMGPSQAKNFLAPTSNLMEDLGKSLESQRKSLEETLKTFDESEKGSAEWFKTYNQIEQIYTTQVRWNDELRKTRDITQPIASGIAGIADAMGQVFHSKSTQNIAEVLKSGATQLARASEARDKLMGKPLPPKSPEMQQLERDARSLFSKISASETVATGPLAGLGAAADSLKERFARLQAQTDALIKQREEAKDRQAPAARSGAPGEPKIGLTGSLRTPGGPTVAGIEAGLQAEGQVPSSFFDLPLQQMAAAHRQQSSPGGMPGVPSLADAARQMSGYAQSNITDTGHSEQAVLETLDTDIRTMHSLLDRRAAERQSQAGELQYPPLPARTLSNLSAVQVPAPVPTPAAAPATTGVINWLQGLIKQAAGGGASAKGQTDTGRMTGESTNVPAMVRWFAQILQPYIGATAQQMGVPAHIAQAVALHESSSGQFDKQGNVVRGPVTSSGERAVGAMQLMPATAASLGVNPFDAVQNAQGGDTYLAQLAKKYKNDWTKVLEAYNWGEGNLDKSIAATKKAVDAGIPVPESAKVPQQVQQYASQILQKAEVLRTAPLPARTLSNLPTSIPAPAAAMDQQTTWQGLTATVRDLDMAFQDLQRRVGGLTTSLGTPTQPSSPEEQKSPFGELQVVASVGQSVLPPAPVLNPSLFLPKTSGPSLGLPTPPPPTGLEATFSTLKTAADALTGIFKKLANTLFGGQAAKTDAAGNITQAAHANTFLGSMKDELSAAFHGGQGKYGPQTDDQGKPTYGSASQALGAFTDHLLGAVSGIAGFVSTITSAKTGLAGVLGGATSGAGLGMQLDGPIGAAVGAAAGAVLGGIVGEKNHQVQINLDNATTKFKLIMDDFALNNNNLQTTVVAIQGVIAQLQEEKSSSKKGGAQYDQAIQQYRDQLGQLQTQQTQLILSLHNQAALLSAPQGMQDLLGTLQNVLKQYQQFEGAARDANELATANTFLASSLSNLDQQAFQQFNQDETQAIQDALQLNDLLYQRTDLLRQYNDQVQGILAQGVLTRQMTMAQSKGQQIEKLSADFDRQMEQMNEQISVAQYRVQAEGQIFQLATTRASLEMELAGVQKQAVDMDMLRISALTQLVQAFQTGNFNFQPIQDIINALQLQGVSNPTVGLGSSLFGGGNLNSNLTSALDSLISGAYQDRAVAGYASYRGTNL